MPGIALTGKYQAPLPAFYDVKKPTVISTEASSYGIDGILLQELGSRTLIDSEKT